MTVKIITNLGATTSVMNELVYAATQYGFSPNDAASGSRSKFWRSILTLGPKGLGYTFPSNQTPDHCVIARADKLLTLGTYRVTGIYSGGYTTISGFDINPLTSANLVGPRAQDLCVAFTPSATTIWAVKFTQVGSDPEAAMISKLYFGVGFAFGKDIQPKASQIQPLPRAEKILAFPQEGDLPFEIEQRMSMVWEDVTSAKIDEFLALPQVLKWPFFIYDPNTYLFPWKLEHVILESYRMAHKNINRWDLQLNLGRLKHYD